jgi:hypothetical protein
VATPAPLRSESFALTEEHLPVHTGERFCIGAAILYVLGTSLPWYRVTSPGVTFLQAGGFFKTYRGWEVGFLWSWVPVLLSLGVAVVSLHRIKGRALPEAPLPWHQLTLIASVTAGYITGLRLFLSWSPQGIDLDLVGYASSRSAGLFVVAAAAALLITGAVQQARAGAPAADPEVS